MIYSKPKKIRKDCPTLQAAGALSWTEALLYSQDRGILQNGHVKASYRGGQWLLPTCRGALCLDALEDSQMQLDFFLHLALISPWKEQRAAICRCFDRHDPPRGLLELLKKFLPLMIGRALRFTSVTLGESQSQCVQDQYWSVFSRQTWIDLCFSRIPADLWKWHLLMKRCTLM